MRTSILSLIGGLVLTAMLIGLILSGSSPSTQADTGTGITSTPSWSEVKTTTTALQIDINGNYGPFGSGSFFKLLADFTPARVAHAHVAISNVPCDKNGTSPFVVVAANANVGAGKTKLAVLPLNSTSEINDVSSPGNVCTYHVDIVKSAYKFPVTDIALVNGANSATIIGPDTPSSATIFAKVS